jgi:hypothetical protein
MKNLSAAERMDGVKTTMKSVTTIPKTLFPRPHPVVFKLEKGG